MSESIQTRLFRWKMRFFPAYRGTGALVRYISADWNEVRIELPLNWRTRNYVGTIFGGSMYAAVDPVYMLMLLKLLGKNYIVWDKSATIQFLKPGRKALFANFRIDQQELALIKAKTEYKRSIDRVYNVALEDEDGLVCAQVEKIVYIRKKDKTEEST